MAEENKNKNSILTLRLGDEEKRMVDTLKGEPHWINMSEFLRNNIRKLYAEKMEKRNEP